MKNKTQITEIMENSIHLINEQYNQPLHLNTIARQNFMSPATYSRYFFELTQCSFSDYINHLRVEHAKKDLIATDRSLTQIALEHGFSNSSSFSKIFRSCTALSPSDYRKTYRTQYNEDCQASLTTQLTISDSHARPYKKSWLYAANAGSACLLSYADLRAQLLELADSLGIEYIRIWDMFSPELFPHGLMELTRLDFSHLDTIFDFLTEHHLKPWINLTKNSDFLLSDIAEAPSDSSAYGTLLPPKELLSFYENLFRHWIIRYGQDAVSQWIFECWYNDMDNSDAAIDRYIESFTLLRQLLKRLLPDTRLGALCNSLPCMEEAVSRLLSRWPKAAEPDFISVFSFPYTQTGGAPEKMRDSQFIQKSIRCAASLLERHHMERIPIYVTQWNMTASPRNAINDSAIAACVLLSNIEETLDYPYPIVYCYASDLCMSGRDTLPMVFGGIGMFTRNFLPKPVYYALSIFKKLPGFCLAHGPGYIITTDRCGRFDLLLFNTAPLSRFYYEHKEYEITTFIVLQILYQGPSHTFDIKLRLPEGFTSYRLNTLSIIPGETDLLGHLKKFGESVELSYDEICHLRHTARPEMTVCRLTLESPQLTVSRTLKPYEICHLSFCPI